MITLVVDDYDTAIQHYVNDLGFTLVEDTPLGEGKRWVVVEPGPGGARLLLAPATTAAQRAAIGSPAGGRVAFFLYTDDFDADYERFRAGGVTFEGPVRDEVYGKVVVFADAYGNRWDFIQRR
ncbi:VOC domain-containing protein [Stackebrandtia soli]